MRAYVPIGTCYGTLIADLGKGQGNSPVSYRIFGSEESPRYRLVEFSVIFANARREAGNNGRAGTQLPGPEIFGIHAVEWGPCHDGVLIIQQFKS